MSYRLNGRTRKDAAYKCRQLALDFTAVATVLALRGETLDEALALTFPLDSLSDEELYQWSLRLFPPREPVDPEEELYRYFLSLFPDK
jgi:hypothetical protein